MVNIFLIRLDRYCADIEPFVTYTTSYIQSTVWCYPMIKQLNVIWLFERYVVGRSYTSPVTLTA